VSRLLIAVALFAVLYPRPAEACDCASSPICHSLWAASAVFLATADRVTSPSPGSEDVRLVVDEVLRGEGVGKTITLHQTGLGTSCDFDFTRGGKYLVFATKVKNGSWQVLVCSGTRSRDPAAESDLTYIRSALASPGTGTVSGYAYAARLRGDHSRTGASLKDLLVTLRAGTSEVNVRTGPNGEFRFDRVRAGRYSVVIGTRRITTILPAAAITVGAEACLALTVVTDP
jgi:hypothetical protein